MFLKRRTYLDWASAAPVTAPAWRAFMRAALAFGNPASPHEEGRRARVILEAARADIARLTEVKTGDIIFTSGATEANNLAIRGLVRPGSHVLYLASAHASIIESVKSLEGVIVEAVPVHDGHIDLVALEKLIRPATVLVTLDAVCGETGTVWETHKVRAVLPPHVLLHVDASQAPFTQKISRAHFRADLLTLDAQKVGGMRGIGVLIVPGNLTLRPIVLGGGQERGLRSGTEAPALAAAFATALTAASLTREAFATRAVGERARLKERILKALPNVYINEGTVAAPNILNLSLPGRDTDYLVTLLDIAGFALGTRSACESDSSEGSRAVFALTGDRDRAFSTLRISWGPRVKERELTRFVDALKREVDFIDKATPKSHY